MGDQELEVRLATYLQVSFEQCADADLYHLQIYSLERYTAYNYL